MTNLVHFYFALISNLALEYFTDYSYNKKQPITKKISKNEKSQQHKPTNQTKPQGPK